VVLLEERQLHLERENARLAEREAELSATEVQ